MAIGHGFALLVLALMQGCASAPPPRAVVYVSNADSREIGVLALDRTQGTTQPLQTVPVGGTVMPLAVSPDRRFLYAALRSEPYAVAGFAIAPRDGTLTPLGQAPLPDSM